MKKNTPRSRSKRPTATLNLKAKEVKKDSDSKEATRKTGTSESATGTAARDKASSASKPASDNKTARDSKTGRKEDKKAASPTSSGSKNKAGSSAPKSPPPAPASGGGFMSHMLASIVGAVLGILGLSFASHQNMLPSALKLTTTSPQTLERLHEQEQKIARLQQSLTGPGSLSQQIAELGTRMDSNSKGADGVSLRQKVAGLENTLKELEKAARTGKGGKLAGLTAVTKQLAKANRQSVALETELVKVREEQNRFREDLAALRGKQADFIATSAKISDELAKLKNSTAKIVANASRPPDISAQINPVVARLGELTAKIDGVINREARSKAEGRNIALALSLGELKRAVNAGTPYKDELARVSPHAPPGLDLSVLSQHAEQGLITEAKLRKSFAGFSQKALASEHTAKSGSFVDQMLANAKSLVQVRPTGLVEGDTTGAILSRMEYKLDRRDLGGVLEEAKSLQGSAAQVMQPWLKQASARYAGSSTLRALEDRIRNALAGADAGKG